jgi:hypothetical protein
MGLVVALRGHMLARGARLPMNPDPMTLRPVPALSDAASSRSLFALLLILRRIAIAGMALINTGLGRSRSASQSLLGNLGH